MPSFDNNNDIASKKRIIRREKIKELKAFNGIEEDSFIIDTLLRKEEFKSAPLILAFYPLKTEPDITPILNDDRIALPFIENGKMYFSKSKTLQKSELGFLEPKHEKIVFQNALMLVPLLAFDDKNYRLGRGSGYYDKFIKEHKEKLYTIGIAYSISKIESVPIELFDQRVDEIIYKSKR